MNKLFKTARRVSTPIIAITTPDQSVTTAAILDSEKDSPIWMWDAIKGIRPINKRAASGGYDLDGDTLNPITALELWPERVDDDQKGILILKNAHAGFVEKNWSYIQAISNVREPFKANNRTLVLLAPEITIPVELANDILVIDEPLPDAKQLEVIIRELMAAAKSEPTDDMVKRAVDATLSLNAFAAEQAVSLSLVRENGPGSPITIDLNTLWTRKVQTIEQTPGLSVWRGDEKFSDIEGYVNLKEYGMSIINGKRRPHCVVFIEEGNKTLGTNSDSSGVSQGYIQQMLTYMENTKAHGIILLGPPGTSKSHFSKSMGNEAGCPTIALDMGGMKNSLVGESERRLRQALKVISAVGQGEVFFILSCNSIATLDPALLRRFKKGIFFLDLPTAEESKKIWDLYLKKYNIPKQKMPPSANWSGAEIKTCCDMADELGIPLVKAAQYIVPVAISARKEIDALRAEANNNFISASHDGVYTREEKKVTVTAPPRNLSGLN